jgi:protein FAM50
MFFQPCVLGFGSLIVCGEFVRDDTKKVKKRKKVAKATLSFALDEEDGVSSTNSPAEDDADAPSKRAKLSKNPDVDTSFLPDREREEEERKERERLRQDWLKRQEEIKQEDVEVTYSFWDGSGHRKSVMVTVCHS